MGEWETKDWGRTRCQYQTLHYSRHELELLTGGYCSVHYHGGRSNLFHVIRGKVRVVVAYGWQITYRDLGPHDTMSVRAHAVHQFQVLEGGICIEDYLPDGPHGVADVGDIHRLSVGGRLQRIDAGTPGLILPDGTYWRRNPWTLQP